MADQRAQYTEEAIGAGHPTKADTINRLALIEHNTDGTHKYDITGYKEIDLREFLSVGFVTDGSIDYSTEMQAAIDEANASGGSTVFFPNGTWAGVGLKLKTGVILKGSPGRRTYPYQHNGTKLLLAGTGNLIDTDASTIYGVGMIGLSLVGLGAGVVGKGVRLQASRWGTFRDLTITNFADEGFRLESGLANIIQDSLVINCLLDRSRGAKAGAMYIAGTDQWLSNLEITASSTALSDSNQYITALMIEGSTHMVDKVVGEISDVGFYINASRCVFTNCRSDLNYGDGFQVVGAVNKFTNCFAYRNSVETTNTYDGWVVSGHSNKFSNCEAESISTDAWAHRYGFVDNLNSNSNKNRYVNCTSSLHATGSFYVPNTRGPSIDFGNSGVAIDFTSGDATPSVSQWTNFLTNNSTPTTITFFDDGVPGQIIQILCNDNNTTIDDNTTIYTNTDANKLLVAGRIYRFRLSNNGSIWYEFE